MHFQKIVLPLHRTFNQNKMKKLILISSLVIVALSSHAEARFNIHIRQYSPSQIDRKAHLRDMATEKRNGFTLDKIVWYTHGKDKVVDTIEYIYVK